MAYRGTHPQPPAPRGFTLVEIIVVVVIIIALMAVLIPVLGGAKKNARKAAGLAQMQGMSQAIESFYTEFHALPGPIPSNQYAAFDFCDSQNLFVALSRRYYVTGGTPPDTVPPGVTTTTIPSITPTTVVAQDSGIRPVDRSPWGTATDKPYDAYLTPKADELNKPLSNGASSTLNTIPLFVDSKVNPSAPLPILYFRQVRKFDASITGSKTVGTSAGSDPLAAFYANSAASLATSNVMTNFEGLGESGIDTFLKVTANNYLQTALFDTVSAGPPAVYRQKGGYVLISPGIDRIYGPDSTGKTDDIIVSGGL